MTTGPGENNEAEREAKMRARVVALVKFAERNARKLDPDCWQATEDVLWFVEELGATSDELSRLEAERDSLAAQVETLREALVGLAFRILDDGSCFCWFNPRDDIHSDCCKNARSALAALGSAGDET